MNEITINGILEKSGESCIYGNIYRLKVKRRSGTADTLLVISPDDGLIEGGISIRGRLASDYIRGMGVPAFIVPGEVRPCEPDGQSEAVVTGVIKKNPVCRKTRKQRLITSILLRTDDGMIPVILWGTNAVKAENEFKAGDTVKVSGRMQSRHYPDRKNAVHITYELSAGKIESAGET